MLIGLIVALVTVAACYVIRLFEKKMDLQLQATGVLKQDLVMLYQAIRSDIQKAAKKAEGDAEVIEGFHIEQSEDDDDDSE